VSARQTIQATKSIDGVITAIIPSKKSIVIDCSTVKFGGCLLIGSVTMCFDESFRLALFFLGNYQ